MIFIVVKFTIRPEYADDWLDLIAEFTEATRNEPGNVSFEWFRSQENPNQFALVEAFTSSEAGEEHVNSEHFKTSMSWIPDYITETPEIVNVEVPGEGWSRMKELEPRHSA